MTAKEDEMSEDYGDSSFETPSPEKKPTPVDTFTFKLQVDGTIAGEVVLPKDCTWDAFLTAAKQKLGVDIAKVLYDDKYGFNKEDDIECKDAEDWEDIVAMMEEDEKWIKGVLTLQVQAKKGTTGKKEIVQKPPDAEGKSKAASPVPEAVVRKLLLSKGKILEGCAAMDKSGLGLVTTAELAKQLEEVIGCSSAEAESLVWSGGAWREIVPNGNGHMVDYKMFCLRARLVDAEEAAMLSSLSNPDVQAARMAILERPVAFKDLMEECQGAVSAKQCEQILKDKGAHLMAKQHAAAMCAHPGSAAAQKDMRVLADELELVDTLRLHRSPLLNLITLGCVRDFALSDETKTNEAIAASPDGSCVLPADKFCEVYEKLDADSFCCAHSLLEAPALPQHTVSQAILTPMLSAATGALREDKEININIFTNDFSIAHESEIRLLRAGRRDSLQKLRRKLLMERNHVIKHLESTPTIEHFKKIITAAPLSFSAQEADEISADVPTGSDGKQDLMQHVQKLQFSETHGTDIDKCSKALFAKYDALCSSCETKEPGGKEGCIGMEEFADTMDLVNVDSEIAKKVRQVLLYIYI